MRCAIAPLMILSSRRLGFSVMYFFKDIPMFGYIGLMFSCVPIPVNAYAVVLILGATIIPIDIIRKVCFEKVNPLNRALTMKSTKYPVMCSSSE